MNICVIPAKGTSRRIPNKNIRHFHGKPMLAYAIETARLSGLFDHICVSTENHEVETVAKFYGAEIVKRPFELAEIQHPDCGTQEVMRHAVDTYRKGGVGNDFACCIYPCTPLMTVEDLTLGYERIRATGYYPYVYVPGWYYWGRADDFLTGRGFDGALVMGIGDRYIDINTMEDWGWAEEMYSALKEVA